MQSLNIKEARANLGRLLDKAERGETVIITRYGKQSACLSPIAPHKQKLPTLAAFRADISTPKTGLGATVLATRQEERN